MSFWQEPIEIRRLWRGPLLMTPMASCACTLLGRVIVVVGVLFLFAFLAAALVFEVFLFVHDPVIGFGSGAIVGAFAWIHARWKRRYRMPPDDPDDPTEGTGVPIPRVPSPAAQIGAIAEELPRRQRYG